jgi:hypothetical protein
MKVTQCMLSVLLAGAFALAGCGKSDQGRPQALPPAIDMPKFQQAFSSPTPAQQSTLEKVNEGVRYGMYPDALAALDKLASDPALTEPQKKAVSDLIQGIKQAMASPSKAPAR